MNELLQELVSLLNESLPSNIRTFREDCDDSFRDAIEWIEASEENIAMITAVRSMEYKGLSSDVFALDSEVRITASERPYTGACRKLALQAVQRLPALLKGSNLFFQRIETTQDDTLGITSATAVFKVLADIPTTNQ